MVKTNPFYLILVRTNWDLPVQPSAALENYLEKVKLATNFIDINSQTKNEVVTQRSSNAFKQNSDLNVY